MNRLYTMLQLLKSLFTKTETPQILSLGALISQVRKTRDTSDANWLYRKKGEGVLNLMTEVGFGQVGINEDNEDNVYEIYPEIFAKRGFEISIDEISLQDCIHWADKLSGRADNQAAIKVLEYYLEFDSVPNTL